MTTFHIPDMSCGHCKATIETTIKGLDPSARITFNMDARDVQVTSQAETENLITALAKAGYPASPV